MGAIRSPLVALSATADRSTGPLFEKKRGVGKNPDGCFVMGGSVFNNHQYWRDTPLCLISALCKITEVASIRLA